jgi:hypothetical protein
MSQYDFGTIDPNVMDGTQLALALNSWRDAVNSWQRGATRPSFIVPGQMWINDSGGPSNWVVNVYFGAAGDKPLLNYNSTTGAIVLAASIGATLTAATLLAEAAAGPMVRWNATGNPADTRAWRATVRGDGTLRFSAYSDAGVEGPWVQLGRDGRIVTSTSQSAGLVQLYGEAIAAAGATELIVQAPPGAKLLELVWDITSSSFAANSTLALQLMAGSTVINTGIYGGQYVSGNDSSASATPLAGSTFWPLGTGLQWAGTVKGSLGPNGRPGTLMLTATIGTGTLTGRVANAAELDCATPRANVTAFRFSSGTAFAAGSMARLLAAY